MPRNVTLPDGRTLVIPDDATPDQLAALRTQLRTRYPNAGGQPTRTPIKDTSTIGPPPSLGSRLWSAAKQGPTEFGGELASSMMAPLQGSRAVIPGTGKT